MYFSAVNCSVGDDGVINVINQTSYFISQSGVETETIAQKEVIVEGEPDASGLSQMRIDKLPINLIEQTPNGLKKDEISYYSKKDKEEESIIPALTNQVDVQTILLPYTLKVQCC